MEHKSCIDGLLSLVENYQAPNTFFRKFPSCNSTNDHSICIIHAPIFYSVMTPLVRMGHDTQFLVNCLNSWVTFAILVRVLLMPLSQGLCVRDCARCSQPTFIKRTLFRAGLVFSCAPSIPVVATAHKEEASRASDPNDNKSSASIICSPIFGEITII